MTAMEQVLKRERQRGLLAAQKVQECAQTWNGTQIYEQEENIPSFDAAIARMNMMERPVGFVCRSPQGRMVRLLQKYDSNIFSQEPEQLSAQWGVVWSTDPAKAKPFVSLATSPYNRNDCCTSGGRIWRSAQDGNVWEPGTEGAAWEELGTVEQVREAMK